ERLRRPVRIRLLLDHDPLGADGARRRLVVLTPAAPVRSVKLIAADVVGLARDRPGAVTCAPTAEALRQVSREPDSDHLIVALRGESDVDVDARITTTLEA